MLAILLGFPALALMPAPLVAQDIEGEIAAVAARLDSARAAQLPLISPGHFVRAGERLADARAGYGRGGKIDQIRRRLAEASRELGAAEDLHDIGAVLLKGALEARADALQARAPEFAPDPWTAAEKLIREAGSKVEAGKQNDARTRSQRAETLYREAELTAIRADVLGRARDLQIRANILKAGERAPLTFSRADSLLSQAEAVLRDDRHERTAASRYAEQAAAGYERAVRIAKLADSVQKHDLGLEDLVLRSEAELARIAAALNFEPDFDEGLAPVTDQVLAAVRNLQEDRTNLQREIEGREQQARGLLARIDSLDARLQQLGQREATVTAELRERERRERTLREVQAIFTPEEAEVLRRGNRLTVRLFGISFPVGSADIRPESFSLLTKLQRVIRAFPEAPIVVEGHTDSRGNKATNEALSKKRALSVRQYLLANMPISADRIRAIGYGESRPIATNGTEEGRARNRRIDVTLELPER